MYILIVTGTPGTGKTTLSKELSRKLNFYYIDVSEIIDRYGISEGYDKKRQTKIVDVKKLNNVLIKEINNYRKLIESTIKQITLKNKSNNKISMKYNFNKKITSDPKSLKNKKIPIIKNNEIKNGVIIDSHLSHYLPKKYVDLCVVTKCDLKVLEKRLKDKKYSQPKVRENLDAEIFDICLTEAKDNGHTIFVIPTTKGINIKLISRKIGGLIDIKKG
jgi:adenylate kinase